MRAVCYARVSTNDQAKDEKVSIPDQIEWAKELSDEKGWEWIRPYVEPGIFGDVEIEDRPALSELVRDAINDKFDILLINHSSRLSREPDIGLKVCRILGQRQKQVYFRNSPIEPVAPDKFAWGVNIGAQYMTAFALIGDLQDNVARSERARMGARGLAERGILRNAPYGYVKIQKFTLDKDGKQKYVWNFKPDTAKALVVKEIFKKYITPGGSLRSIMLDLNRRGVLSPSGKSGNEAWSSTTIRNILKDVAYIGKLRWGRKLGGKYLQGKSPTGKQRRVISKTWLETTGNQPKIVGEKIFSKAQEKLGLRNNLKGRAVASRGLLTGLVKCGRCGRNAYYKTRTLKRKNNLTRSDYICPSYITYKTCQRHIMAAKKLESAVINDISEIISNPRYKQKLLVQKSGEKNDYARSRLTLLLKANKLIETSQKRLVIAFEHKKIPIKMLSDEAERLQSDFGTNLEEIGKIQTMLADKTKVKEERKRFLKVLSGFSKGFYQVSFDRQKEFLQSLISSVIVKGEGVKINYRI